MIETNSGKIVNDQSVVFELISSSVIGSDKTFVLRSPVEPSSTIHSTSIFVCVGIKGMVYSVTCSHFTFGVLMEKYTGNTGKYSKYVFDFDIYPVIATGLGEEEEEEETTVRRTKRIRLLTDDV